MLRSALLTVILALSLLAPSLARANEPDAAPAAATEWYGGKIMAADGLTVALMVGSGVLLGDDHIGVTLGVGATSFALAPAFVHYREGRTGAALTSAGLRLGLPAAGMLLAYATYEETDNDDFVDLHIGMGVGALVGMASAMVIDWTLLSDRPVARRAESSYAFGLAPRADGGMTLSLGGTF